MQLIMESVGSEKGSHYDHNVHIALGSLHSFQYFIRMKILYFLYIHFWGIFVAQLVLASDLWENGEALLMLLVVALAPLVVVAFISCRHSILAYL